MAYEKEDSSNEGLPLYVTYAIDFINRYKSLLTHASEGDNSDKIRKTKEQGFKYIHGSDNALSNIDNDCDLTVNFKDLKYNVIYERNGEKIIDCEFPANIGLLSFSNKIDLEKELASKLKAISKELSISPPLTPTQELKPVPFSEFYIDSKGIFMTPRLKNEIVYFPNEENKNYEMLYNLDKYPIETISNIMLSGYSVNPIYIDLNLKEYGYKIQEINIALSNLVNFFLKEGCIPYWGIKSYNVDNIDAMYVWVNEAGGYLHLINLKFPVDVFQKKEKIKANLNSYIRLDNLKSLFGEDNQL